MAYEYKFELLLIYFLLINRSHLLTKNVLTLYIQMAATALVTLFDLVESMYLKYVYIYIVLNFEFVQLRVDIRVL